MSPDYMEAAKNYRCEYCEHHKPLAQIQKVALPKKFCSSHEIGIDGLKGGGTPSSRACTAALQAPATLGVG
eukprot:4710555-Pyramimonas_sp.AAC.1